MQTDDEGENARVVLVLLERSNGLLYAVQLLQAQPFWKRIWSLACEQDLIAQIDWLHAEVAKLTGEPRPAPPPVPVVHGLRGPLFWWWVQQINGTWLAFSLLVACEDGSAGRVVLNAVLLVVTLHWRVPPYSQAKKGQWRER